MPPVGTEGAGVWATGKSVCASPTHFRSLPRPFSLLEVGCGAGILLSRLDPALIAHYVGLDVSSLALDEARITYPNGNFVHSYAEAFSSDANSFDVIIFNESIYYLPLVSG
jgi:ubiquinone/menaquinone biosynthesis C-methylase UbiE